MKARFTVTFTKPLSEGSKVKIQRTFKGSITAEPGADLVTSVAHALTAIIEQRDLGAVNALTVRASIRQ
jgi:hypothetical protein